MELFKIFGTIAINGAQEAENKLNQLTRQATDGAAKMRKGFANIGNAAKTISVTAGAAFAAIGGALVGVAASTEEYRLAMAKVSTAFETAGMTAEQGKKLYQDFYGVLGDTGQATEAINHLAMLTDDQQALSEWTTICTGIYSKFGDSLPIEGLTEAANETARTGALTGGLADALNWAGVNEDEFQAKLDACTTTQEREALIRSTLNGLYTEAGNKYKENAADLIAANEAQARMTDALAVFGEKAQPILTAVKNGFASIVEAASGFLENVDMQAITDAINNAFAWFINTAIPAIKTAVQWVIDNKDLILALVAGIAAGFAAWNIVQIVSGAVTAFMAFKNALALVKAGQLALNVAMKANVIGVVATAVAALVAAFIYLWNNCEGFRNFFMNMWEGIKTFFSGVVSWFDTAATSIGQFFVDAWNSIKGVWSGVGAFFGNVRDGINNAFANVGSWFSEKFTAAKDAAQNAWANAKSHFTNVKKGITDAFATVDGWMGEKFGSAWTGVKMAFEPFIGYFKQIWETVKGVFSVVKNVLSGNFSDAWNAIKGIFSGWGAFFSGLWNKLKNAFSNVGQLGRDIVTGLWNGISNMASWIGEKIKGFGENVLGGIKKFFGIKSPSRLMRDEVGYELARGIGVGVEENADEATEPMSSLVSGMVGGVGISGNVASGTNYTGALAAMHDTLSGLVAAMQNMQIVLDTGAVVGNLAPAMDTALGNIQIRKGRAQ